MSLKMIGMNHKIASVEIREKFNANCCSGFPGADGMELEAVSIFTCNRFELYFFDKLDKSGEVFHRWLRKIGLFEDIPYSAFYRKTGIEVAKHLFRVISGLDSMVLGENQIMNQVKTSYQAAINAGTVGKQLHSLFRKALEVGKAVRRETDLSKYSVSVASTAVEFAGDKLGNLKKLNAMIIGAGEMAFQVARQLNSRGIGTMIFTNRTFERASEFAEKFGGTAVPFSDFQKKLSEADIIISSTGAPNTILFPSDFETALLNRQNRPVLAIDIAIPRDISPDCRNLKNLFLYDLDDLKTAVDRHFSHRKIEAEKAESIISYETETYRFNVDSFASGPLIGLIKERAEALRKRELDRFINENRELNSEAISKIEAFSRVLMAKWAHEPISAIKETDNENGNSKEIISKFFGQE
ncbi:MAG: glutamyl-tRNA reductase [Candidatus Riflebacteria bacterium]|nr:glutamyl-tRNA reductase [Candidatus Riflebacteria bacterium]